MIAPIGVCGEGLAILSKRLLEETGHTVVFVEEARMLEEKNYSLMDLIKDFDPPSHEAYELPIYKKTIQHWKRKKKGWNK